MAERRDGKTQEQAREPMTVEKARELLNEGAKFRDQIERDVELLRSSRDKTTRWR